MPSTSSFGRTGAGAPGVMWKRSGPNGRTSSSKNPWPRPALRIIDVPVAATSRPASPAPLKRCAATHLPAQTAPPPSAPRTKPRANDSPRACCITPAVSPPMSAFALSTVN